jgi:hypothetical protein
MSADLATVAIAHPTMIPMPGSACHGHGMQTAAQPAQRTCIVSCSPLSLDCAADDAVPACLCVKEKA